MASSSTVNDGRALVNPLVRQKPEYVRVAEYNKEPRQFKIKRRAIKAKIWMRGKSD
jgi:hypothetical protein